MECTPHMSNMSATASAVKMRFTGAHAMSFLVKTTIFKILAMVPNTHTKNSEIRMVISGIDSSKMCESACTVLEVPVSLRKSGRVAF
jgi:hypothetical protein